METHEELNKLAKDLKQAARTHRSATTFLSILIVTTCIVITYLIRFYIEQTVHNAIVDEDISGEIKSAIKNENISSLVESGFDRVMENYEIDE